MGITNNISGTPSRPLEFLTSSKAVSASYANVAGTLAGSKGSKTNPIYVSGGAIQVADTIPTAQTASWNAVANWVTANSDSLAGYTGSSSGSNVQVQELVGKSGSWETASSWVVNNSSSVSGAVAKIDALKSLKISTGSPSVANYNPTASSDVSIVIPSTASHIGAVATSQTSSMTVKSATSASHVPVSLSQTGTTLTGSIGNVKVSVGINSSSHAGEVAWSGVSNRPTKLSEFDNDLDITGTTVNSASHAGEVAWSNVSGKTLASASFQAGAFSAKAYSPLGTAQTINIPTNPGHVGAASASHTHTLSEITDRASLGASYLPLSGGTLTGNLETKDLFVSGNLTVGGTTTTVNAENLNVKDKLILVASGSATQAAANGAGIAVQTGSAGEASAARIQYVSAGNKFTSSVAFEAPSFTGSLSGKATSASRADSAASADNASKLNGQAASYYATSASLASALTSITSANNVLAASDSKWSTDTDRYVNSISFSAASSSANVTLTRAGSDTVKISASLPVVSAEHAGVVTVAQFNDWNSAIGGATASSHTHANKAVLDGITAAKTASWDNMAAVASAAAESASRAQISASAAVYSASLAYTQSVSASQYKTQASQSAYDANIYAQGAAGSATSAGTAATSAKTYSASAAASMSAAQTSATNAQTAANNAKTYSASAAASASAAQKAATTASNYATNAHNYKVLAAASASAASQSAYIASGSAADAAFFASEASGSMEDSRFYSSQAATNATLSSTYAVRSSASAQLAQASASVAQTAANNATTYATNASKSAASASTYVTPASQSAASAASWASTANTQKNNAASSATAASQSAATAVGWASTASQAAGTAAGTGASASANTAIAARDAANAASASAKQYATNASASASLLYKNLGSATQPIYLKTTGPALCDPYSSASVLTASYALIAESVKDGAGLVVNTASYAVEAKSASYAVNATTALTASYNAEAAALRTIITNNSSSWAQDKDRYVNTASFASTGSNGALGVKMTLTRTGSDTAQVTATVPVVTATAAGVVSGEMYKQFATASTRAASAIQPSATASWATAAANSHTHSNKALLDSLTNEKTASWDGKQAAISDLATIRTNAASGNVAFGWGNHASAGYVKSSGVTSIAITTASNYVSVDSAAAVTSTGTRKIDLAAATKGKIESGSIAHTWVTANSSSISSANHTHNNKAVLDGITAAKTASWDKVASDYVPLGGGTITGSLVVQGDLTIDGTTTSVNAQNLNVKDKLILVASGSTTQAAANGAGIAIQTASATTQEGREGASARFQYRSSDNRFTASVGIVAPSFTGSLSGTATSASRAVSAASADSATSATTATTASYNKAGADALAWITANSSSATTNTDRYVNTASFASTGSNGANGVKMTLTRAGSDTATVTATIPVATTTAAGVIDGSRLSQLINSASLAKNLTSISASLIASGALAKTAIQPAATSSWATAAANSHTHTNKTVLDGVTAAKTASWETAASEWATFKDKVAFIEGDGIVVVDVTSTGSYVEVVDGLYSAGTPGAIQKKVGLTEAGENAVAWVISNSGSVIKSSQTSSWATAASNSHTHSNKTVLDGITAAKTASWDAAKPGTVTSARVKSGSNYLSGDTTISGSGTANIDLATKSKNSIDWVIANSGSVIKASQTSSWATAAANSHTHSNKAVLDGITAAKTASWDYTSNWLDSDREQRLDDLLTAPTIWHTITSSGSAYFGDGVIATGQHAVAHGFQLTASGVTSHAEGRQNKALGSGSHVEGLGCLASGNYSHAEGYWTTASANGSFAAGKHTTANFTNNFIVGYYNDTGSNCLFAVGCGDGSTGSNILSVGVRDAGGIFTDPAVYVQGLGTYNGTNPVSGSNDIVSIIKGISSSADNMSWEWMKLMDALYETNYNYLVSSVEPGAYIAITSSVVVPYEGAEYSLVDSIVELSPAGKEGIVGGRLTNFGLISSSVVSPAATITLQPGIFTTIAELNQNTTIALGANNSGINFNVTPIYACKFGMGSTLYSVTLPTGCSVMEGSADIDTPNTTYEINILANVAVIAKVSS